MPDQFSLWYKITGVLTVKTPFKATEGEDNKVVSSVQILCTGMSMLGAPEEELAEHKTGRATETEKILEPGLLGVT